MPSLPIFERLLHGVLLYTSSKFADFLKSKATLETEMKTSSLPVLFPETVNWHDWCFGASRGYTNRWSFRETARGLFCLNGYFVFRESVEIRHKKGSMSASSWLSWTWLGALEGRCTRNLVWHVWQEQHWGYFCVELNSIQARHPALPRRENISPFRFLRFSPKVRNIYQQISNSNAMTGWWVDESELIVVTRDFRFRALFPTFMASLILRLSNCWVFGIPGSGSWSWNGPSAQRNRGSRAKHGRNTFK